MMSGGQIPTPGELIPTDGFVIEFSDVSPAQAALYAEELEADLRDTREDEDANFEIKRIRVSPETQDLGTIIGVILAAKATIAIAKGIAKWLYRNNQATIVIKTRDGREYKITNLESGDVAGVIRTLNPYE